MILLQEIRTGKRGFSAACDIGSRTGAALPCFFDLAHLSAKRPRHIMDSTSNETQRIIADRAALPVAPTDLEIGAMSMNLIITGQHLEVTPALKAYVESKLERVIRHFDQIIDIVVVLGVEKPSENGKRQRAEVNLRMKGNTIHLEHFADDLYAAIDGLADKLDRQVLAHKEKMQNHRHDSIRRSNAEE